MLELLSHLPILHCHLLELTQPLVVLRQLLAQRLELLALIRPQLGRKVHLVGGTVAPLLRHINIQLGRVRLVLVRLDDVGLGGQLRPQQVHLFENMHFLF